MDHRRESPVRADHLHSDSLSQPVASPRIGGYGNDERLRHSDFDTVHPNDVARLLSLWAAGATEYLAKPVALPALFRTLSKTSAAHG
jgi:hypothetical protein